MTEQEWLGSTDPQAMLRAMEMEWDKGGTYSRISDRKLRLFACAWWRSVEPHSDPQELVATGVEEYGQFTTNNGDTWGTDELLRDCQAYRDNPVVCATGASLLRTIVGNPWRPVTLPITRTVHHSPALHTIATCPWLTWKDGTIPKMAQVIYDERRWDLMPLLADALEEAGCRDETILRWCRGQEPVLKEMGNVVTVDLAPRYRLVGWQPLRGPSVRGDWCIDLLLGRD